MMQQWCRVKAKRMIHLHSKAKWRASIVTNQGTLHNFATKQRTRQGRMPKIRRPRMNWPQHGEHLRSVCKWIMDSKATKHMTLHSATFDTYKVISSCNVRLDDDSVAKAIGIEMRGIRKKVRITYVLHVLKLQANLLSVSKLLTNGLKV